MVCNGAMPGASEGVKLRKTAFNSVHWRALACIGGMPGASDGVKLRKTTFNRVERHALASNGNALMIIEPMRS